VIERYTTAGGVGFESEEEGQARDLPLSNDVCVLARRAHKVRGLKPHWQWLANLFFVEGVAYQRVATQDMERATLPVVPMKLTTDRRSRLQVVAP
jgi:hypothetical protein